MALLIGSHQGEISFLWVIGFFALAAVPPEVKKVRKHGLETYLRAIHLEKPSVKDVGVMVIGLIGIFALVLTLGFIALSVFNLGANGAESGHLLSETTFNVWTWAGVVLFMYLIVGPMEEYVFRYRLQNFLLKRKSTFQAIFLTNVLFGLLHLPVIAINGVGVELAFPIIGIGVIGCVFSLQQLYTDNLTVPAITHSTYNSLIITLLFSVQLGLV
jgi:membrane protease YdiL (CAAX protease family)